jgi:hypothetical protein
MNPPTDKRLEKLQKLLELANEDYATPDDLIQMSEALLGVIKRHQERLDQVIAETNDSDKQEKAAIKALIETKLNANEHELKYLISELGRAYSDDNELITAKFSKEVKRLERKIPSKVDLTDIYSDIQSLKDGLNSFPTELTINNEAIRDGLELLQGDDRLDISAIKGLGERDDTMSASLIERAISIVDNRTSFLINKINTLQAQVDASSGALTVTTPTGSVNGTNVTFTSAAVAAWIDTDTGHYYENYGYTRSGTTYTLDLAPNLYIRLVS